MKNQRSTTGLAALAFATLLLAFGCGGPQSGNVSQNGNTSQNQNSEADENTAALTKPQACKASTPQDIANGINGDLDSQLTNNTAFAELKKQKDKGLFQYKAVTYTPQGTTLPTEVHLYFGGAIADSDSNGNPKELFRPIIGFLKPYRRADCLRKIILVPYNSIPTTAVSTTAVDGFMLFECEAGTYACPGGYCSANANCSKTSNSNSSANGNSSQNTNSNSNTNRNSNSNKGNSGT